MRKEESKMARPRKRNRKENRFSIFLAVIVVILLTTMVGFKSIGLKQKRDQYLEEQTQLTKQIQKEEQMTIVLTTHYLNEADDADKIYIVDHGQVIAQGSADQIKGNYARNILRILSQDATGLEKSLPRSCAWEQVKEGEFILHPKTTQEALTLLAQAGPYIEQFEFQPGTMDDAFMALTGREVR